MNTKLIVLIAASLLSNQAIAAKFHFPDADLTVKQVTGIEKVYPGNHWGTPNPLWDLYPAKVMDNPTTRKIAFILLGRTIITGDRTGTTPLLCDKGNNNPFTEDDIEQIGSERTVDYEYKVKSKINVNAAVKADMDLIKKYVSVQTTLNDLEASLKIAYENLSGKELTVNATYSEWSLTENVFNSLAKGVGYNPCLSYLGAKRSIIVSVGLVSFSVDFSKTNANTLSSDIQAKLKAYQVPIDISISFKREVTKTLDAKIKNGYVFVSWVASSMDQLKDN